MVNGTLVGKITAENVLSDVIVNNFVKPGFSGIGKFRIEREYTPAERAVLGYFFTNLDSNVYAATDAMPNELWALVMGQYARSASTARDRFLKLLQDVHKKGVEAGEVVPSVDELAELLARNTDVNEALRVHKRKAGEFVDKYGAPYGHASLRDSDVIRMCFEGVSQRVTKWLEAAREGAYQEQSTRALKFAPENLGIPYEVRGTKHEQEILKINREVMGLYEKVNAKLQPHIATKFAHLREEADARLRQAIGADAKAISDKEWSGFIGAKTFDVARYLLPQNMTTSLGITLNSRRFLDMLSEWQSAPLAEMAVLGRVAQIEGMKVSPVILKYGNPSQFYSKLPDMRRHSFDDFIGPVTTAYEARDISTKLVAVTPNIEDLVLASILLNGRGEMRFEELARKVSMLSPEQRREIARREIEGKKGYEIYPKSMEVGSFVFEREYDIGAFRDLQRQRGDRQQFTPYSVIGFSMPPEIEEVGLGPDYVSIMGKVKRQYEELKSEGFEYVAEYVLLMGNLLRHVVTKDPVQGFYEAGLRTQAAGIDSYRKIEQTEIEAQLQHMPAFKGLISYDSNYYPLGRLEETVQRRIREAGQGKK